MGGHVLVVMTDVAGCAEALREVSAARGEIPARRAYPGYLYSDLASLYERCGRIRGRPGCVTVLPVLTMPAGDITHPVPDLTGYITEGQIVLSARRTRRASIHPSNLLSSLSRLMRKGAGPGRTRPDHLDVAAQMLAALARARQVREFADLVGQTALSRRPPVPRLRRGLPAALRGPAARRTADPRRDVGKRLAGAAHPAPRSARHAVVRAAGRARRGAGVNAVAPIRTPPGRAGRQHLLHRLAVAARGADLLEKKLRILRTEHQRLVEAEEACSAAWRERLGEAETWLSRGLVLSGESTPCTSAAAGLAPADVTVRWTASMGVRRPSGISCTVPARRRAQPHRATPPWSTPRPPTGKRYGPPPTTPAHGRPARIVGAEVASTSRRVRALRRHWIPRLQEALAHVDLALEQSEHEDSVRRRWAAQVLKGLERQTERDRPSEDRSVRR